MMMLTYLPVGNEDTEVEDFLEEDMSFLEHGMERSKLRVYIAKYTYNPYEGPNECPETELPLVAGDYVYVYGQMDDDGFFQGELMNGRRGLVPSNFLEPVHEDTVSPITGSMLPKPEHVTTNHKSSGSEVSQTESLLSSSCLSQASNSSSRGSQRGELADPSTPVLVHGALPYPKRLRIDKKLSHSLIIGWAHPQIGEDDAVEEYHIIVNGGFWTAVKGTKQKAVVENINHEQGYRISVCAVTYWGISDENLCVISHGRSVDLSPSSVRMEKLGATTARVAWTPSSSQQSHVVTVEEEKSDRFSSQVRIPSQMTHLVSPPAYRFTFGNLRPNAPYKVTVSIKGSSDLQGYTRFTTPEAGPPDPPLSVQMEDCQNDNYLLVTWLPVTLNTMGTSNGVMVKGYSVHVGDAKVCEVNSPTVDQCTIRTQTLADALGQQMSNFPDKSKYRLSRHSPSSPRWNKHVPPSITVKTKAVNGQESDYSDPYIISHTLFCKLSSLIKKSEEVAKSPEARRNESPISQGSARKRPPLIHHRDSTDVDISFSSDISIPGLHSSSQQSDTNGERKCRSSSLERKSHTNRRILQQTRVVPSIEITQDTSSEEDDPSRNRVASRQSNCSKDSGTCSKKEMFPKVKGQDGGHRGKGSDNDDAVSVSSGHTSSSNGGSALKHSKKTSHRAIEGYQLQRGESAEYSNPEDYMPSYKPQQRILTPSDSEKKSEQMRQNKQMQRHHHSSRRQHSNDTRSPSSHRSRSSSRNGHLNSISGHHAIPRQRTLSSQSGSELASETDPSYPVDRSKLSLFVALYDYDPRIMSPNTDSFDEELSFTEGQLIKVYGDKDEDGFYYGETHKGKRGFVPCNMVSFVEVESKQMLLDLHERGHLPSASPDEDEQDASEDKDSGGNAKSEKQATDPEKKDRVRYFVCLFDYDPQNLSPNIDSEREIAFTQGDIITVTGEMDEDGFYKGNLGGKVGLVPSNFLDEISEQQAIAMQEKKETKTALPLPDFNPSPKPRTNQRSEPTRNSNSNSHSYSSSTQNSYKSDNAVSNNSPRKKGGFISKGRKLFKKLGGSQDGKNKR